MARVAALDQDRADLLLEKLDSLFVGSCHGLFLGEEAREEDGGEQVFHRVPVFKVTLNPSCRVIAAAQSRTAARISAMGLGLPITTSDGTQTAAATPTFGLPTNAETSRIPWVRSLFPW